MNCLTVIVVVSGMNAFRYAQQLVTFTVRFRETGIVRVVVVKVEQHLVHERFQPTGKIAVLCESAKRNDDRLCSDVLMGGR